jgi:hypothetical protein
MSGPLGIVLDEVNPLLSRLKSAAQAQGLVLVGARAASSLVKKHLFELNQQRHRYGRNYYAQAARSVNVANTSHGAAINITQIGIRQRLFGGTITPKTRKYLTIPADPEAYGKRASEFFDLDFAMAMDPNGRIRPALVRRASTVVQFSKRKKKDGSIKTGFRATALRGGEVMFWLVRRVTQAPDPTVLPYNEHMTAVAVEAIKSSVVRQATRSGKAEQ